MTLRQKGAISFAALFSAGIMGMTAFFGNITYHVTHLFSTKQAISVISPTPANTMPLVSTTPPPETANASIDPQTRNEFAALQYWCFYSQAAYTCASGQNPKCDVALAPDFVSVNGELVQIKDIRTAVGSIACSEANVKNMPASARSSIVGSNALAALQYWCYNETTEGTCSSSQNASTCAIQLAPDTITINNYGIDVQNVKKANMAIQCAKIPDISHTSLFPTIASSENTQSTVHAPSVVNQTIPVSSDTAQPPAVKGIATEKSWWERLWDVFIQSN